jgi:uncharacterized protein (TIGR00369 family)
MKEMGTEPKPFIRHFEMTWDDPLASAEAGLRMAGLDYMNAVVRGEIGRPPIATLLGMEVLEVDEGRALFGLDPSERHYNPIGVVHGGIAATVLDSAMGCAVHTTLPAGWTYGSLDLSARYVRPITGQTGRILCEGVVVHRGKSTATAEGRVWAENGGKLLAHGTGSALLRPPS